MKTNHSDEDTRKNATSRAGMTLVEVMIAMAVAGAICAGFFEVGWKARRYAEYARLSNEARSLAKERMEEILSYSFEDLAKPSCTLWNSDTNLSSSGFAITRKPRAIWHTSDQNVSCASSSVYAEVHIDVVFASPLWGGSMTNSFGTIKQ